MNPRNPVNGSTYLVLGILSLVVCPFFGPVAWSMGNNALHVLDKYERNTGDVSQRGLVEAGRICGMIGTAFLALGLCLVLLRSCAVSESSSRNVDSPPPMTTMDGQPLTDEQQRQVERDIRNIQSQPPGSQSHVRAPK